MCTYHVYSGGKGGGGGGKSSSIPFSGNRVRRRRRNKSRGEKKKTRSELEESRKGEKKVPNLNQGLVSRIEMQVLKAQYRIFFRDLCFIC